MSEADKEADLLKNIKEHGSIRIDTRPAFAFWGAAINRLKEAGKVETDFVEMYEEQYSYIEITLPRETADSRG